MCMHACMCAGLPLLLCYCAVPSPPASQNQQSSRPCTTYKHERRQEEVKWRMAGVLVSMYVHACMHVCWLTAVVVLLRGALATSQPESTIKQALHNIQA